MSLDLLYQKYKFNENDKITYSTYSEFYIIRDKNLNIEYILKKIKKSNLNDLFGIGEKIIENEIDCLTKFKGTNNIVNMIEYYNDKKNKYYYIILEKMDGDLNSLLKTKYKNGMSSIMIRKIFSQINSALKIMLKNKKCHRNLQPNKFLFSYTYHKKTEFIIKLCGFLYSCNLDEKGKVLEDNNYGTFLFKAPEIEEGKYSSKCDLYSLGITLYLLKTGENIFEGKSYMEILINKQKEKFKKFTDDPILNDLIKKLVVNDPQKRINWEDYFNHPFFKEEVLISIDKYKFEDKLKKEKLEKEKNENENERIKKIEKRIFETNQNNDKNINKIKSTNENTIDESLLKDINEMGSIMNQQIIEDQKIHPENYVNINQTINNESDVFFLFYF